MNSMQYDIERHTPAKLARAYQAAADTAACNPYLTPCERKRRAKMFRRKAQEFRARITRTEI